MLLKVSFWSPLHAADVSRVQAAGSRLAGRLLGATRGKDAFAVRKRWPTPASSPVFSCGVRIADGWSGRTWLRPDIASSRRGRDAGRLHPGGDRAARVCLRAL